MTQPTFATARFRPGATRRSLPGLRAKNACSFRPTRTSPPCLPSGRNVWRRSSCSGAGQSDDPTNRVRAERDRIGERQAKELGRPLEADWR